MKNLTLTFLLALLVVLTCFSVRRIVGGVPSFAGQKPMLVAIGPEPVPPPPHSVAIGPEPVPPPPHSVAIGPEPVPPPPHSAAIGPEPVPPPPHDAGQ